MYIFYGFDGYANIGIAANVYTKNPEIKQTGVCGRGCPRGGRGWHR
jgi:hypothetical protein